MRFGKEKALSEQQIQQFDDEINLLDYVRVIWKRKFLIIVLVFITVLTTSVMSLFMKNIYQSTAIITPISSKEVGGGGGLSALALQFGGLPGISLPGSSSVSEIVNLLNSNILREKLIEKYNLMPVLFYEKLDGGKKDWKKGESDAPTVWNGLRMLKGIVKVNNNTRDNTIIISVEFHEPEMTAKMAEYFLAALTDHMSSEAKRVAMTNRKYLEEQLGKTADPLIRQKIYNLIATQIETAMMSEVKENFAFKVIDPPRAPDKRIKPKRSQMVMISFMVSLFAGVFLAFFLEYIEKMKSKGGMDV